MRMSSLIIAAALAVVAPAATAQPAPPDYGFDFVTIGDPGNALASGDLLSFPGPPTGGVDYEYRIMRSRVPAADYIEFVNAYWPFRNIPGDSFNFQLLGENLLATNPGAGPGEDPGIVFFFGDGTWGANASLNAAARYANWLHNGKVSEPWAFETGAYDFVEGETRVPLRNPDARFWIPSPDEWNKAVYYDPDRFGEDQPGYWRWPNQTNEPLTPGLPGVGETPALDFPFGAPLGMYPDVQTPWGLTDISGLGQEFANGAGVGSDPGLLFTLQDSLGNYPAWILGSDNPAYFRLASIVPAPAGAVVFGALVLPVVRRSRRA